MLYCSPHEFSSIFHYFAKRIIEKGLSFDTDTCSIHEYSDLFINRRQKSINSLQTLQKSVHGYLSLDVQECSGKRHLAKVNINDRSMYIIGGVYISPFARSVLQSKTINGLLLDTTWRVMPMYVTSIIMASTMNIGIPIGFSFGSCEDKILYERHFQSFAAQTSIDLSKFVLESDQGSALIAICEDHHMTHVACLRHLLVSLRFSAHSYAIGKILRCTTIFELNNALTTFSILFSKITDPDEMADLNKALGKVGLEFADGSLNLVNQRRFDQVSMLSRVEYRMPSTTNSLESTHGHLNKKTPRRNGFWPSMYRLCEALIIDQNMLNKRITHNYSRIKRTTEKKAHAVNQDEMHRQRIHYSTRINHCNCNENKLESAILAIDIPCTHRLSLGSKFEECPKINIELEEQFTTLVFNVNELHANNIINQYDENQGAIMYAINIIKRFSCYKNKKDIEKFVIEHYNQDRDTSFLLGEETSLTNLIYKGIHHFTEKKKAQKLAKKPYLSSQL